LPDQFQPLKAAFSIKEFGLVVGLSRTSVYHAIAQGRVKTLKWGKRTLIPAGEVQAFLAGLQQ
jgi:excisionase family DNA binding protein